MAKFHETISERSVYLRYFHMENLSARIAHEELIRRCFIDYDREMALVADFHNPQTSEHEILAVGRLTKMPGDRDAEVAVLVGDPWQGQGLGTELLRRLIEIGRSEKLENIAANILPENEAMKALAKHFDFQPVPSADRDMIVATLEL